MPFCFNKTNSTIAPVSSRVPKSRAGKTLVLLSTRQSPDFKKSVKLLKFVCTNSPVILSILSKREVFLGSIGV